MASCLSRGRSHGLIFLTRSSRTIIVAEVYALLVAVLGILFRARGGEALALRPCRALDVAQAAALCAAAYLVTGAIQAIVAPQSLTATIAVLHAIGADDGRRASAGPGMTVLILVRACLFAAIGEGDAPTEQLRRTST